MLNTLVETLSWWPFAVALSLVSAAMFIVNQEFKAPARDLILWRGFGAALFLAIPAVYFGLPEAPAFYGWTVLGGVMVAIFDRMIFQAASQYGAGLTSRMLPLSIWITFLVWLAISEEQRTYLMNNTDTALAITAALIVGVLAVVWMKRGKAMPKQGVLYMIPVVLMIGAFEPIAKLALTSAPAPEGERINMQVLFSFGVILGSTVGLFNLALVLLKGERYHVKDVFAPQTLKAGLLICFVMIGFALTKNIAMIEVPNPSYVSAIALSAPLWVLLWNKVKQVEDPVNVVALSLFLAATVSLVLLTGAARSEMVAKTPSMTEQTAVVETVTP